MALEAAANIARRSAGVEDKNLEFLIQRGLPLPEHSLFELALLDDVSCLSRFLRRGRRRRGYYIFDSFVSRHNNQQSSASSHEPPGQEGIAAKANHKIISVVGLERMLAGVAGPFNITITFAILFACRFVLFVPSATIGNQPESFPSPY